MRPLTMQKIVEASNAQNFPCCSTERDLAISLLLEASALLELFQQESAEAGIIKQPEDLLNELADVLIYAALLSEALHVNQDDVVLKRLKALTARRAANEKPHSALQLAVQPYADSCAQEHFHNTIEKTVSLKEITPFIESDFRQALEHAFPSGHIRVWGTQPNRTTVHWEKLCEGDLVLFYAQKVFSHLARIGPKTQNCALAKKLWGTAEDGTTWENIYFIKDLKPVHIELAEYNKILNYSPRHMVQSFCVHDREKTRILMQELALSL